MKRWAGTAVLIFVAVAAWRIGGRLSSDALSMAVGVLFGVMAGVPTALLLMASGRRQRDVTLQPASHSRHAGAAMDAGQAMQPWSPGGYLPPQPPVIVLAGPQGFGAQTQGVGMSAGMSTGMSTGIAAGWPPDTLPARRFKVVGEQEAWLDEW